MKNKILERLRQNAILKPIIDAATYKEFFLFIVLLGLLPSIANYSLFQIYGLSDLNFIFYNPIENQGWHAIELSAILLLPIAVFIIFSKRKFTWILGILPIFLSIILLLLGNNILKDSYVLAITASILSKIAFLFFITQGRLRSLSFISFSIIMLGLLHFEQSEDHVLLATFLQSFVFFLFALAFRFVYLFITQNLSIFAKIKRSRLLYLLAYSLLLWIPILLFAVPGFYLSKKMNESLTGFFYDQGIVERHHLKTDKTIKDLYQTDVKSLLQVYHSHSSEDIPIPDEATIQLMKTSVNESLDYILNSNQKELISNNSKEQFKRVYGILRHSQSDSLDMNDFFIRDMMGHELERIFYTNKYPNKSEFELDMEVSFRNKIKKKEDKSVNELERSYLELDEEIEYKKKAADGEIQEYIRHINATRADILEKKNSGSKVMTTYIEIERERGKENMNENINHVKGVGSERIREAPDQIHNALKEIIPDKLEKILPSYAPRTCSDDYSLFNPFKPKETLYWILCVITENIKERQRNAYGNARDKILEESDDQFRKLSNHTEKRFNDDMNAIAAQTNEMYDSGAKSMTNTIREMDEMGEEEINKRFDQLEEETRDKGKVVQEKMNQARDTLRYFKEQSVKEIQNQSNKAQEKVSGTLALINKIILGSKLFSDFLLYLIILKSFTYVFTRVAFQEKEDLFVSLDSNDKTYMNGSLRLCGNQYSIPAGHKEHFYVSRKFRPTGRAPKIGLPYWNISIVDRLRKNVYLMNQINVIEHANTSVDFRSLAGAEFIEWTLSEGEEVVFDYKQLVALTDTVELKSDLSLRMTSMLFRRTFFKIAKGPGKIVLMSKGIPLLETEDIEPRSVHIDRLIAWQKSSQFSVESELNIIDMYLSGLYLKRCSRDIVIIDADETVSKRGVGLARFIGKFIFPNK